MHHSLLAWPQQDVLRVFFVLFFLIRSNSSSLFYSSRSILVYIIFITLNFSSIVTSFTTLKFSISCATTSPCWLLLSHPPSNSPYLLFFRNILPWPYPLTPSACFSFHHTNSSLYTHYYILSWAWTSSPAILRHRLWAHGHPYLSCPLSGIYPSLRPLLFPSQIYSVIDHSVFFLVFFTMHTFIFALSFFDLRRIFSPLTP